MSLPLSYSNIYLRKIYKILKKNGILLFSTLAESGFDIKLLGKYSKSICPPLHLNFFNPKSVSILLDNCGFEVIEISTPGKLDVDIVKNISLEYNLKHDDFLLSIITGDSDIRNKFQNFLIKNKLSSHMRILVRKK